MHMTICNYLTKPIKDHFDPPHSLSSLAMFIGRERQGYSRLRRGNFNHRPSDFPHSTALVMLNAWLGTDKYQSW